MKLQWHHSTRKPS